MRQQRRISYSQQQEEEEDDDLEDSNFLNSPTNWICQSLQYKSPIDRNRTTTSYTMPTIPTTTTTTTAASCTTNDSSSMTRYDEDDDQETLENTIGNMSLPQRKINFNLRFNEVNRPVNSPIVSYDGSSTSSSSKIVAPNVAKLSPSSTVEVVLHSTIEDAVILCSTDVLKMRSQYFQKLLLEQEISSFASSTPKNIMWRSPIVISESSPYEGAAFLESIHEGKGLYCGEWNLCWARLSGIWQIKDMMVEYTQQIENHVKNLFEIVHKNHWRINSNYFVGSRVAIFRKCTGLIPAILTGYVVEGSNATPPSNIRVSFELDPTKRHLYSSLQLQSRQSDESVGNGNGNGDGYQDHHDTISIQSDEEAYSMHSSHSKDYSFKSQSKIPQRYNAKALKTFSTNLNHGSGGGCGCGTGKLEVKSSSIPKSTTRIVTLKEIRDKILAKDDNNNRKEYLDGTIPLMGEVGEPFWIQQTSSNEPWEEPDLICQHEIETKINLNDKKILWEMISLLIEFPEYQISHESSLDSSETTNNSSQHHSFSNCEIPTLSTLSNPSQIASIFHKKEYQVLWSIEAPDSLPLITSQDLVRFAFCPQQSQQQQQQQSAASSSSFPFSSQRLFSSSLSSSAPSPSPSSYPPTSTSNATSRLFHSGR